MERSIAARYAARQTARFVSPSAKARERRLAGLFSSTSLQSLVSNPYMSPKSNVSEIFRHTHQAHVRGRQ